MAFVKPACATHYDRLLRYILIEFTLSPELGGE